MVDVAGIGEILIDFAPLNGLFQANPGGAVANCMAAVSALTGKSAFIGMVGMDFFGDKLISAMKETGVDVRGIKRHPTGRTTLAFVSLNEKGERDFAFFRNPGADFMFQESDVDISIIDDARALHYGSLSLTDEPARSATFAAVSYAKASGKLISYDPNYRAPLWKSVNEAVGQIKKGLAFADVVKMSEEEAQLIFQTDDFQQCADALLEGGAKYVFITLGEAGAYYASEKESGHLDGFKVNAVDTTGCGDAFMGAILYSLFHMPNMPLRERVRFANAVGALTATKKGAIPALPMLSLVNEFLK